MIDAETVRAHPEAVRSLGDRAPVGTTLGTAEIEWLPLEIRRRAFFSARVESVRFLEEAKRSLQRNVNQFGINRDRASFVKEMQDLAIRLGLRDLVPEEKRGTIEDVSSARRLGLIFDVQTGLAKGEAQFRAGMDPDVLQARPAQELVRIESRKEPRDWVARWRAAGGEFFGGRMLALKTDPIWVDISRFGLPWPPFDFQSGMGVRNVNRREAQAAGLLARGERVEPVNVDELTGVTMEASLAGLDPRAQGELRAAFGDAGRLNDGVLKLVDDAVSVWAQTITEAQNAPTGEEFLDDIRELLTGAEPDVYLHEPISARTTHAAISIGEAYDTFGKRYAKAGSLESFKARLVALHRRAEIFLDGVDDVRILPESQRERSRYSTRTGNFSMLDLGYRSPTQQGQAVGSIRLGGIPAAGGRPVDLDGRDLGRMLAEPGITVETLDNLGPVLWLPDKVIKLRRPGGGDRWIFEARAAGKLWRAVVEWTQDAGAVGRVTGLTVGA